MIEVEHLSKNYGPVAAIRDVSFQVGKGEVVGFVGPNGAGKSTTLRIITGFLGATAGGVRIAGYDVAHNPMQARRHLGYMPETAPLYTEMRVGEYLRFRAALKQVPGKHRPRALLRAMERAGVEHFRDTLIAHLSKGYRQRVALADALIADPPLLILDEPTAGLDPNQIREVRRLLKELGETHTILLSTHILSEVEATCDRALVIHQGKLVLEGPLHALRDEQLRAILTLRDPAKRAQEVLGNLGFVDSVEVLHRKGSELNLRVQLAEECKHDAFEKLVCALVQAEVGVQGLSRDKRRLEDIFSQLTGATTESEPSQGALDAQPARKTQPSTT